MFDAITLFLQKGNALLKVAFQVQGRCHSTGEHAPLLVLREGEVVQLTLEVGVEPAGLVSPLGRLGLGWAQGLRHAVQLVQCRLTVWESVTD